MTPPSRCPVCGYFAVLETQLCARCESTLAFHWPSRSFVALLDGANEVDLDGQRWAQCSNWNWNCNWLAPVGEMSAQCFSCRLTRRRPDSDDTVALEMLAETAVAKRRLLVQLFDLGLPVTPYFEREGGLAFDLLLGDRDNRVVTGHANGVITIDLGETLDAQREALRVRLGEAYRTMLGHFRHEIGHYYQQVLVSGDPWLGECRELFGDERASYREALDRHYRLGAQGDWQQSFISEYATMHPSEDFAETFAHYLHITGTLTTAARTGVVLEAARVDDLFSNDVVPRPSYADTVAAVLLDDWHWLSLMFNRVNRSMGHADLYPFEIPVAVASKLDFVHRLVNGVETR